MTRRPAITVLEALMAILVMAIGLLALLTLFPLGAVSMGQALKDQRCAEASINATSLFKAFGIGGDTTDVVLASGGSTIFESPTGLPPLAAGSTPTYPVYVDPFGCYVGGVGYVTSAGGVIATVGTTGTMGGAALGIPRATLTATPPGMALATAQRWFTLQDDITYADNGLADVSFGLQRQGRYSWAYMVRRVSAYDTGPLDLTVVVYAGRSPGTDAGGNPLGETAYNATFGFGGDPNVVQIDWTTSPTKPALRRGNWIMDARMTPVPQGYFYRVVSVTDVGPTLMEIQVQKPLGGPLRTTIPAPGTGTLVVMENIAEVFEKLTNY